MDKIEMWITAAIGSLIGTAIVSMFTGGGAGLVIMKWALSTAICRGYIRDCRKEEERRIAWIKVTPETMPPDNQEVIATIKWRDEKHIEFGLYRENNEWCKDYDGMDGGGTGYYSDDEVTHWMPYPEPVED